MDAISFKDLLVKKLVSVAGPSVRFEQIQLLPLSGQYCIIARNGLTHVAKVLEDFE